ncbi:hypothetical protein HALDL1_09245 [Halobacterium sp. DL1]|jgi:hypothetical protein|nr:hypothetical protein HALDL1_09245 [Halobacterium sp. DL1]
MAPAIELPSSVFLLGALAAFLTLAYFVVRGLQADHATGDYHFTWGVGIVVLFLSGLVPGFVGVGLYLTVERGYPLYWLVLCLLVGLGILAAIGASVTTGVETSATDASLIALG